MKRMLAFADLITITEPKDPAQTEAEVTAFTERLKTRGLKYYPSKESEAVSEIAEMKVLASALIKAEAGSLEFAEALTKIDPYLQRWSDVEPRPFSSIVERFAIDEYYLKGIDSGALSRPQATIREEAKVFKGNQRIFDGFFKTAPSAIQMVPWSILGFYDHRRMELNNRMPWFACSLLLACGLLVQMRFSDFRVKDARAHLRADRKPPEAWVRLWEDSQRNLKESMPRLGRPAIWIVTALFVLLFLFIEFFLNTPCQRIEWAVNAPVMLLIGGSLPVLGFVLWDVGSAQLNSGLSKYSSEFVHRQLRPMFIAIFALMVLVGFSIVFSCIFLLPANPAQFARGILQISLAVALLLILLRASRNMNEELQKLHIGSGGVKNPSEDQMNRSQTTFFMVIISDVEWKLTHAAMICLMPIPAIISVLI